MSPDIQLSRSQDEVIPDYIVGAGILAKGSDMLSLLEVSTLVVVVGSVLRFLKSMPLL